MQESKIAKTPGKTSLGKEIGAASFSQFRFAKCENDAAPYLFTIWERLCKKSFHGASRQIIFWETHDFWNFASRNFKNHVSLKIIFCRGRRQITFYTTYLRKIFCRGRRQKPFYTTPKIISQDSYPLKRYSFLKFRFAKFQKWWVSQNKILPPLAAKDFLHNPY